ncbi:MAG: UbiA prenyltransferase [Parachlamydiales bacterium]|nr:UbiA prenyltransferase [Parachlamydiales bacterium]
MGRWLIYLKERFQLIPQLILIGGLSLIAQPQIDSWAWVFAALLLIFFLLRAMDETKDYEKDCVAHPERPLPQGLISRNEMKSLIDFLMFGMVGLSFLLGWTLSLTAGFMYFIMTGYLWAMFHEFKMKNFLSKRPLIYAISHQLIVVPLSAFLIAARGNKSVLSSETLLISMVLLGGFFAYEICRKLDPKAHPILKTYIHIYGKIPTVLLAGAAVMILSLCGYFLGLCRFLWPTALLLLAALVDYCKSPSRFKAVENISIINLLACIYSLGIQTVVMS